MTRDGLLEKFATQEKGRLAQISLDQQMVLLGRYLPAVDLHTVTQEALQRFFTEAGRKWSINYLRRVYRAHRAFFAWAYEYAYIPANPMAGLPRAIHYVPGRRPADTPILIEYASHLRSLNRSTDTVSQRVGDIRRFMGEGDPLLATPELLGNYLRLQRGWSQEYRRKIRASFVSFYGWAHDTGRIATDPTLSLQSIRPGPPSRSPIDERSLLEAFYGADLEVQAIIALAGSEGLRRSEIARLHTRDRVGMRLSVHGKGDQIRVIPLNELTYELLVRLERRNGSGYYFRNPRTGLHFHPSTIYKKAKAHIGSWCLHSLRHRTATIGLRRNGNVRAIQELFGHASLSTTQIYTQVSFEDLGQVVSLTEWPREPGRPQASASSLTIDLENLHPSHVPLVAEALSKFLTSSAT